MKIHNDLKQGSDEWFAVRLGKFTASSATAIAAKGAGLDTLVFEKVAETLTGVQKPSYTNPDMERGHELEEMARNAYELEKGIKVVEVGFCELDKHTGASPDGLVEDKGLFETKCPNDANFAKYLYDRKIDTGYNWQMLMQMLVTGREWNDYVVYNPNFPTPIIIQRIMRNETEIAKIKAGLAFGIGQKKLVLEKIKNGK